MPEVIYKQRGGLWMGEWRLFGITIPILFASYGASWPFGVIEFHDEAITVKGWPFTVSLRPSDINEVRLWSEPFWRLVFLGAYGLRIDHHAGGANFVVFLSYSPAKLIESFEQKGISVVR